MTIALRQRALTSRFTMRFFRRQPDLRAALAERLRLPADAFDPVDFIEAAMNVCEPDLDPDPLPLLAGVHRANGRWRIEPAAGLLDGIIGRLASGAPIEFAPREPFEDLAAQGVLFDLNIAWPMKAEHAPSKSHEIDPDALEPFTFGPNVFEQEAPARYWLSSEEKAHALLNRYPALIVGRRTDPYLAAFIEHDRRVRVKDGSTRRATLLWSIGRDGVLRTFESGRRLDADASLHDIHETIRAAAARPDLDGFRQIPHDQLARCYISKKSHALLEVEGRSESYDDREAEALLEPFGRVIRSLVAAGRGRPIGAALKAVCAIHLRLEHQGRRSRFFDFSVYSWLVIVRSLTNRTADRAVKGYQAVAISPTILGRNHDAAPAVLDALEAGTSVVRVAARQILGNELVGAGLETISGVHGKPLMVLYAPHIERSVRLALPLMSQSAFDQHRTAGFKFYAAAMAVIGQRNTHIKPRNTAEIRAIAAIGKHVMCVKPDKLGYVTTRRIARIAASRLQNGQVRQPPRDAQDALDWLAEQIWMLDGGSVEAMGDHAYRVNQDMRAEALFCASAIRMRGYPGIKEISRRFHEGVNRHYAERNMIILRSSAPEAIRLRRQAGEDGLALPVPEDEDRIIQLTTGQQLMTEGAELSHCVASYVTAVQTGRSFILSIADADGRSTVELSLKDDHKKLVLKQHRSRGNDAPPENHKRIVQDYVDWLNDDAALLSRLEEAKSKAGEGWSDPYWPIRSDQPAIERIREIVAREIARIFLPPAMAKATPREILDYIAEQEQVEHLYDARLAA